MYVKMHLGLQSYIYEYICVCAHLISARLTHIWVCEQFAYNPVELHFLADESILIPETLSNNGITLQCEGGKHYNKNEAYF